MRLLIVALIVCAFGYVAQPTWFDEIDYSINLENDAGLTESYRGGVPIGVLKYIDFKNEELKRELQQEMLSLQLELQSEITEKFSAHNDQFYALQSRVLELEKRICKIETNNAPRCSEVSYIRNYVSSTTMMKATVPGHEFVLGPPSFTPVGPNLKQGRQLYATTSNILYCSPQSLKGVFIPKGFVFDSASIPFWARWFYQPDKFQVPSLIHDYLYAFGEKDGRPQADEFFRQLLIENGHSKMRARIMHLSVRLGGDNGYSYHRDDKIAETSAEPDWRFLEGRFVPSSQNPMVTAEDLVKATYLYDVPRPETVIVEVPSCEIFLMQPTSYLVSPWFPFGAYPEEDRES